MQSTELTFKKHLLICTRLKEGKECCGGKSSQLLVDELKAWIKENNLKSDLKVTGTQCLGQCESGITAFLYPAEKAFTQIKATDAAQLKNILLE